MNKLKMEKLTTDRQKYFDRIIEELTSFETIGNLVYCEVGQLLTHGFSFLYRNDTEPIVKMKIWNSNYDNERFKLGIFNLDRLSVNEMKANFSKRELRQITQLINSGLDVKEFKGIVLDGLFCQLKAGELELKWNIDDEMNYNLKKLIQVIRKKVTAHIE